MTTHPLSNALLALGYIALIATGLRLTQHFATPQDSFFVPIAMLSLFVLSAVLMGTIFFLKPVLMYLDGQKEEAVRLFLTSLGYFAVGTVLAFVAVLFFA